jgi:Alginate export
MHRRFIAFAVVVAVVSLGVAPGALAQQSLERFGRQLEQIRRDTDARALSDVPANQRALIDYGAFLNFNYFSIDDAALDNHILRQYELIGYVRINLDAAQEIYLRGRTGWQDFNDGDSFDGLGDERIDCDLDRGFYRFDSQGYQRSRGQNVSDLGVRLEGGRDLVYWGNGLTMSEVIDGGIVDLSWHDTTLQIIGGVTPVRTVDIDPSRPNFDHNTRRGFYGANLAHQIGQHRPYIYGLVQRDYNDDDTATTGGVITNFDYNSYYLGAGIGGAITDRLLYGVEAVYEGGTNLSNSFAVTGPVLTQIPQTEDDIRAWAGDARLDYLLLDRRHSRLSAEVIIASGDDDRLQTSSTFGGNAPNTTDHAFNGFGLLNTGLAFAPAVSNILIVRAGGVTFPMPDHSAFEKLQVGVDLFMYNKLDADGPIDEPTFDKSYLGFEPDIFINWQISSDVTIALRYGIFFPGSAIVADDDPRQFIGAGVTYAF